MKNIIYLAHASYAYGEIHLGFYTTEKAAQARCDEWVEEQKGLYPKARTDWAEVTKITLNERLTMYYGD